MFDNPIFFLILISLISAISEWIGKRRKAKRLAEEESEAGLPFPAGPDATVAPEHEERRQGRPEPQQAWEERLRRLLEGEGTEATAPVARAPEPPQMPRQAPIQSHPEPIIADAVPVYSPPSQVGQPHKPVGRKPTKAEASQAAAWLQSARGKKGGNKSRKPANQKAPATLTAGFRSPRALKQSIVAAVVLGPPKGSAEETDLLRL